jgi:spermidine synthase
MNGNEELVFTNDGIYIKETMYTGDAVMHIGENELMKELANLVTKNGGDILEIGFGMHLSADEIQLNPNVKSHTIIEVHPEIYKKAIEWSKDKPNTKIILGDWIDVIPTLNTKYDGILHDTHKDNNIPIFLDSIKNISNMGCIVGMFQCKEFDKRFNAIRFDIKKDEFDSLPYKENGTFEHNQYELKYTTFNGVDFYKKDEIKNLI